MMVYDPNNQTVININFREVAPSLASTDMFNGNETLSVQVGFNIYNINFVYDYPIKICRKLYFY